MKKPQKNRHLTQTNYHNVRLIHAMYYRYDDPIQFEGKKTWWMSFPVIESKKLISEPFGSPPEFNVGDKIRFREEKPDRIREVLKVEWHCHRYQWVYVVETKCSDAGDYFEPYWFADKIEMANELI